MFNKKTNRIAKKIWTIKKTTMFIKKNNIYKFTKNNQKISILKKQLNMKKKQVLIAGNKNLCSVTGKYKSIFNSLKISRHEINKMGNTSHLPNYSKLSW